MRFKAPKTALLLVVAVASVGIGILGHVAGVWEKLAAKVGN